MEISRRRVIVLGGTLVAASSLGTQGAQAAPQTQEHAPGRAPRGVWLAGDTHVHDDHSSDGSLPRQTSDQRLPGNLPVKDQIGEGERVGLDFMPLTDHRTYDQHWDPQWTSSRLLLIPGEEANGSPHAVVLGAVDTIVDGANPPGSPAFRHVQQSIWDAHAQDAVWSVAHPDDGEVEADGSPNANASVQAPDIVEVWNRASDPDGEIDYAENRWNHGFRFGAVGACDCHFRELWDIAGPGQPTTWVFAAEATERAILDALKAGRTTVSRSPSGPFVTIEADLNGDGVFEAIGGDEIVLTRAPRKGIAKLRVHVRNGAGTTLYVFGSPGRSAGPLATYTPSSSEETYLVPINPAEGHSWFRAEVRAPGDLSGGDADPALPNQLRAATSPVFVSTKTPAVAAPEIPLPDMISPDDRAVPVVGDVGAFAGFADVATVGRTSHVVAEVHRDGRVSVVYQRVVGDRAQGKVVDLAPRSNVSRSPRVVARGRDVWVAWQETESEKPRRSTIYLRHSTNGGQDFGKAVKLSEGTARAIHPALAVVDGGRAVVAWADNNAGAFDVFVQVVGVDSEPHNISAVGKAVDAGTPSDSRSPRFPASLYPSIAVGPRGDIVVTWQDNRFDADPGWTGHTPPAGQEASGGTDPDNWEIMASRRGANQHTWSVPVRLSPDTEAADRHPSIAVDRDGGFVVMWEAKALRSSGANLSLRVSRSTDAGVTWSAAQPVALEPSAMSQRPRLGQDQDGVLRAVWYDSRSEDWRWRVFTARFDEGSGWAAPERLTGPGNATWPAVSAGVTVFTSDRGALRRQRDLTQQVFVVRL
ncbi:CehA/McbA family metallohydrolase [Actinopolymorpha pittospori]